MNAARRNSVGRFLVITSIVFFMMSGLSSLAQERIEGLLYLDHSPVSIEVTNGIITKVERLKEVPENFPKVYVAPGFIDNQVNGYAGISFALGGSNITPEGAKTATKALWKDGVTTYLPTLTTNDRNVLINSFRIMANVMKDPEMLGSIAGFHLEGPFISPVDGYRGAHPLEHVRKPDWDEFVEYYKAAGGKILQVTLAPEIEGNLDMMSRLNELGIVVALGHHNASADQITAAIDRGARISTHLGNGAANTINRHRNPFWPQLADDRLMISIIADGFHLLPEQIRTFYKVKGPELTILTSDVTSYAALTPGKYKTFEGTNIEITPEGMLKNLDADGLYGSASPLIRGVGIAMKVTGCSLADAVRMSSTNPAKLYGLNDRGELKPGKRADMVLFTLDDFKVSIQKTIIQGKVVYDRTRDK